MSHSMGEIAWLVEHVLSTSQVISPITEVQDSETVYYLWKGGDMKLYNDESDNQSQRILFQSIAPTRERTLLTTTINHKTEWFPHSSCWII